MGRFIRGSRPGPDIPQRFHSLNDPNGPLNGVVPPNQSAPTQPGVRTNGSGATPDQIVAPAGAAFPPTGTPDRRGASRTQMGSTQMLGMLVGEGVISQQTAQKLIAESGIKDHDNAMASLKHKLEVGGTLTVGELGAVLFMWGALGNLPPVLKVTLMGLGLTLATAGNFYGGRMLLKEMDMSAQDRANADLVTSTLSHIGNAFQHEQTIRDHRRNLKQLDALFSSYALTAEQLSLFRDMKRFLEGLNSDIAGLDDLHTVERPTGIAGIGRKQPAPQISTRTSALTASVAKYIEGLELLIKRTEERQAQQIQRASAVGEEPGALAALPAPLSPTHTNGAPGTNGGTTSP